LHDSIKRRIETRIPTLVVLGPPTTGTCRRKGASSALLSTPVFHG
jgi:hypothetical protein